VALDLLSTPGTATGEGHLCGLWDDCSVCPLLFFNTVMIKWLTFILSQLVDCFAICKGYT
jgi:hypothetical protein